MLPKYLVRLIFSVFMAFLLIFIASIFSPVTYYVVYYLMWPAATLLEWIVVRTTFDVIILTIAAYLLFLAYEKMYNIGSQKNR